MTFFLNGVGLGTPEFSLRYRDTGSIEFAEPETGSASGVWRVGVRLAPNFGSGTVLLLVDNLLLGDPYVAIWVAL